jgi:hypothetical protein
MKVVINDYIDVAWDPASRNVYVAVAGKKVSYCSFLLVQVASSMNVDSIDDLAWVEGARRLEGHDIERLLGMTPEEHLQAHASNIQAWVENDYNPALIHSNIAFPLLKALVDAGDQKARRVLEAEIRDRVVHGSSSSRMAMLAGGEFDWDIIDQRQVFFEKGMQRYFDHDAWVAISKDDDDKVREIVSQQKSAPLDVLIAMTDDKDWVVRRYIADGRYGRPLPVDVIEKLARDENIVVRAVIAEREDLPARIMLDLSRDKIERVRSSIAGNPKAPRKILVTLASDDDPTVRKYVASNPSTPAKILGDLSVDDDYYVRMAVADNRKTPMTILQELSEKAGDFNVREAAEEAIRKRRK